MLASVSYFRYVWTLSNTCLHLCTTFTARPQTDKQTLACYFPKLKLNVGKYSVDAWFSEPPGGEIFESILAHYTLRLFVPTKLSFGIGDLALAPISRISNGERLPINCGAVNEMTTILFISMMDGAPWGGSEELWSRAAARLVGSQHEVIASVLAWPKPAVQVNRLQQSGVK